jgi:hypothetical protein
LVDRSLHSIDVLWVQGLIGSPNARETTKQSVTTAAIAVKRILLAVPYWK